MIQRALLMLWPLFSRSSVPLRKYVVAPRIGTRKVQQHILMRLCLELNAPRGCHLQNENVHTETTY